MRVCDVLMFWLALVLIVDVDEVDVRGCNLRTT